MTKAEKLLKQLLLALKWQGQMAWEGTEHQRILAKQKVETIAKLAEEALDEKNSSEWAGIRE